jgi:hypothetical protein
VAASFPPWRRRLGGSWSLRLAVVVGVGRCSERGLLERYVHLRRHFLVGVSFGMVRPRRPLANLGRLWAGGALACAILELEPVLWSS